ncbi:DUF2690 domain-containing protein [Tengunoibacter tsumagoiensis]|uniref:DUF2690 domain-containing protein n=1 Tax=Tengunoibacter tsumagoiensis TaxID=2014871 RepID=A0A402A9A8_9CHLR|nr:DUF2690 domain-containing protein [Tengunoibacter tsumagoiensis]GCE15545.1 hypothetical protein KTT_54040 [Tengunoibacter tsumagoiensis]
MHKGRNMFNVKRLVLFGLMALVLCTALALNTGAASAHATVPTRSAALVYCGGGTGVSCDGKDPIQWNCYLDAIDKYDATSSDLGGLTEDIILRYSPTCGSAWALVIFSDRVPSGHYGNAIITRTSDNRQYDCTTGDKIVYPGQTSCYSGMVDDPDWTTAWAAGMYRTGSNSWIREARTQAF